MFYFHEKALFEFKIHIFLRKYSSLANDDFSTSIYLSTFEGPSLKIANLSKRKT